MPCFFFFFTCCPSKLCLPSFPDKPQQSPSSLSEPWQKSPQGQRSSSDHRRCPPGYGACSSFRWPEMEHADVLTTSYDTQVFPGNSLTHTLGHQSTWTHLKGKVFDVLLHRGVTPSASNQSLCIKDSVLGVGGQLVLGSISNQTLALTGEGHVRWSDAVTLVIGDDLHTTIFENSNTTEKKKN